MDAYDAMWRVLTAPNKPGPRMAWIMVRASYLYSRAHGLTMWEALTGALPMLTYLWKT